MAWPRDVAGSGPCEGHAMWHGGQVDGTAVGVRWPHSGAATRQGGHAVGCVGQAVQGANGDGDGLHRAWGWPTEWRGGGAAMR